MISRQSARKYWAEFINDELGKEYSDRVLRDGSRRWAEMGFLSEGEAEAIMNDDKIASIGCHFGVHIVIGLATPPHIDVITLGTSTIIASALRSTYTLGKRRQAVRRKDEAMMRIHTWPVALFALIPKAGNFSYPLVHLGGRSKVFGILIDESLGTPIIRRCENKRLIGRISKPYYRFIKRWFNNKPLYDFIVRWFRRR